MNVNIVRDDSGNLETNIMNVHLLGKVYKTQSDRPEKMYRAFVCNSDKTLVFDEWGNAPELAVKNLEDILTSLYESARNSDAQGHQVWQAIFNGESVKEALDKYLNFG